MSDSPQATVFYLVWGSAGAYSDHRSWVASVQFSRSDAERVCEILNGEARAYDAWASEDYSRHNGDEGRDRRAEMVDVRFSWDNSATSYSVHEASDDPTWSHYTRESGHLPAIECPRCHASVGQVCKVNNRVVLHDARLSAAETAGVCVGECASRYRDDDAVDMYKPCGKPGCHGMLNEYQTGRNAAARAWREGAAARVAAHVAAEAAERARREAKAAKKAARKARRAAALAARSSGTT